MMSEPVVRSGFCGTKTFPEIPKSPPNVTTGSWIAGPMSFTKVFGSTSRTACIACAVKEKTPCIWLKIFSKREGDCDGEGSAASATGNNDTCPFSDMDTCSENTKKSASMIPADRMKLKIVIPIRICIYSL